MENLEIKEEDVSEDLNNYEDSFFENEEAIKTYLRDIKRFHRLTKEEENEINYIILNGTENEIQKAREKLVNHNLRLVISVAKRYNKKREIDLEDLIQEGNSGLIKAAKLYDPTKECKFSTYATNIIKQKIIRCIIDTSRTIRYPASVQENIIKYRTIHNKLIIEKGIEPTLEEIAIAMEVPIDLVEKIQKLESAKIISLNTQVGMEEDTEFEELIPSDETEIQDIVEIENLKNLLYSTVFPFLSEREQTVLKLRYGLIDGKVRTLEEVGKIYGVSRERIRKVEDTAKRKARLAVKNSALTEYLPDVEDAKICTEEETKAFIKLKRQLMRRNENTEDV